MEVEFVCYSYNECVVLEYCCDWWFDCRDMFDEFNCEELVLGISFIVFFLVEMIFLLLWLEIVIM